MTSSSHHNLFLAHMQIVEGKISQLKFREAAQELLRADRVAVHAGDHYEVHVKRDELITRYGVDWAKAVREFKL